MTDNESVGSIILESNNPLDLTDQDLIALAEMLHLKLPDETIEVAYDDQFGAGVTFFEVIHVWLPSASFLKDFAYTVLLTELGKWARSRFEQAHRSKRPKSIIFHDAEGNVIDEYLIETVDGEVVRVSPKSQPPRKRPAPRHRK